MRKIVYMEWVKTRPRARYEIGGSGIIPVRIGELPEARDALEINDFNLYGYRPLIRELADRYEVSPDQVVTAPGTSMANYLAIAAIVGAGDEVLVIDFGGQYSQLIARRVRECGVFSTLLPHHVGPEEVARRPPSADR